MLLCKHSLDTWLTIDNQPNDFAELQQEMFEAYKKHDRIYFPDNFWITLNTSIYNIKEKTLRLYMQEDYDHYYDFSLK